MYPNIQAYDRGVMFNPDGRLFQVEYAKEAVRRGGAAIGMITKDGIAFVAHKNVDEPMAVLSSMQKVFRIDAHIGAAYSGIVADGLHVIDEIRSEAQSHRMVYDEVKSVEAIAKGLSFYILQATFYGGVRPYGVSLLVGGIDTESRLYEVGPDAALLGYKADAIGVGKKVATDMLVKEYKEGLSTDEALKLGIKILNKINEGKLASDHVDIGYIEDAKEFTILGEQEIAKYF
ncbi:MAG: archaeal proteasome endopeptidase complex subunit alpha [Candidatus Micrarchaeota archaeon]|nr:archaeal proteasome endopeptidase complex subunit alpha [Candidatus Micrarchaeota archaeon]